MQFSLGLVIDRVATARQPLQYSVMCHSISKLVLRNHRHFFLCKFAGWISVLFEILLHFKVYIEWKLELLGDCTIRVANVACHTDILKLYGKSLWSTNEARSWKLYTKYNKEVWILSPSKIDLPVMPLFFLTEITNMDVYLDGEKVETRVSDYGVVWGEGIMGLHNQPNKNRKCVQESTVLVMAPSTFLFIW